MNTIQDLNFELMKRATFNHFNGEEVVKSLEEHKDLWRGAVMTRGSYARGTIESDALSNEARIAREAKNYDNPNYWTTPIKGEPKGKMPVIKDVNGVVAKEGDTIKFSSVLPDNDGNFKTGTSTIKWQEPYIANASGKRIEGSWIGNGVLRENSPFEIIKRADGQPLSTTPKTGVDDCSGRGVKRAEPTPKPS